jgi:hypothetical protein
LPEHQEKLFATMASLRLMQDAFSVDNGAVFTVVNPKITETYAASNEAHRKEMIAQIAKVIRANQTGVFSLGVEEVIGLRQLGTDIQANAAAPVLRLTCGLPACCGAVRLRSQAQHHCLRLER